MEETSPGEDDEWLEVVRGEPRTSTHSRGAVEGNTSSGESDEEKELSINEYDKKRVKQPLRENTKIQMNTRILSTELTCPICLDLLTNTMTTKECLHRFCADCITTALLRGNKECPTCRKKLVSKRSLRPDPNFDDLIRKIWPDRHRYDAMLLVADQDPGDSSLFAREVESADSAAKSCRDDQPSCSTAVSPKATTPPEVTESLEGFAAEEDSENGIFCDRRSPTWMRCGAICEEELNKEEKAQLLRFQKLADVIRKREEALGRSPVGTHSEKSLHGSSPLSIDSTSNDHSQSSRTGHLSPKMEVDGESSEGSSDDDQTSSDEGELPSTDGDSNESREDTRKDKVDDLPRIVKVERESDHKNGEEEDSARKKEDTDKKTFNNGISNGSREKSTSHHSTEDMEIGRERDLNGEDLSEEDIEEMHMLDNCILINPHLPTTPEFQHGSRMNSNPRKRSHKLSRRSNMGGEGSSQQGVPSSQDVDMESVTVLRDGLIGCAASTIKKQGATSVKEEGTIVPDKEPMFSPYPKTLEPFPEINAAIMYSTQNHSVNDSQPTAAEVNEEDDEDYEWEDEDCLDVYDIDEMLIQMCTNTQTQKTEEPSEPMEISVKEELLDEDCLPENIDRSKRERILANLKMLSAHYVNLCQESEKDLKELEGLKLGSLQHLQEIVNEEVETFEKVKQSQWYTSAERGDEVVYYESCELPTWKTKTRDGLTCEGLKAVANETISMKQLIYELSESSTSTTCSSSYLQSSPASSPLSVSSVDDQQQQPATPANEETKEDAAQEYLRVFMSKTIASLLSAREIYLREASFYGAEALPASTSSASVPLPVTPTKTNSHDFVYTEPQQHPSRPSTSHNVRPPYGAPQTTERLQQWLADAPANPLTPDDDRLERKFQNDEESGENEDAPPENYELEAELRPSASLLTRNVPREVCQTRFLRSHHTTSMEHLAEFLYQRWLEEVHSRVGQHEIAPDVPRPDHFYVFNSQERYCKCILLHESLVIAQAVTSKDSHVVLYFDTERAKISATEQSLLSKIVPIPDLDSAGNLSTGHVQQP